LKFGGRQLVGTANELTSALGSSEAVMEVKYNNLELDDVIRFEGGGSVEFARVAGWTVQNTYPDRVEVAGNKTQHVSAGDSIFTTPSGLKTVISVSYDSSNDTTTITISESYGGGQSGLVYVDVGGGPFRYVGLQRDLDGTGANAWDQGDGLFSTSQGEGFIDLYAEHSFTDASQSTIAGPTIAFREKTGSAYTDVEERAVVGNLHDTFGYSQDVFGLAAGKSNGDHITVDPSNGVRLQNGSDTLAQLSGNSLQLGTSGAIVFDPKADTEASIAGTLEMKGPALIRDENDKYRIDPTDGISLNVPDTFVVDRAYTIHDRDISAVQDWVLALHATKDDPSSQISSELEVVHPDYEALLNVFADEIEIFSRETRTLVEGTKPDTVTTGGHLIGPDFTELTGSVLSSAPSAPDSGIRVFMYDDGSEERLAYINATGNAYTLNSTAI